MNLDWPTASYILRPRLPTLDDEPAATEQRWLALGNACLHRSTMHLNGTLRQ
jgi:hypothetical protein